MQNVKYIGGSGKQKGAFSGASAGGGGTGDVLASANFESGFVASAYNNVKTLIAKAQTGLKMIGQVINKDTPSAEGLYFQMGEHLAVVVSPTGATSPHYEILGNAKCDYHGGTYKYRYAGTASRIVFNSITHEFTYYSALAGVAEGVISWYRMFAMDNNLRLFSLYSSTGHGVQWDRQSNLLRTSDLTKLSIGGGSAGVSMDISRNSTYIQELLNGGVFKSLSNIATPSSTPLQIAYEDANSNSITTLLTTIHRATGAAAVGIGGQHVISSERNNCSGSDMVTAIFGGFQDAAADNSEVYLSNNQNGTTKRIFRGDSKGRVYLSDTMMITPEGGLAILVSNDIGFSSVKGYICKASASAGSGVQLVATDAPGNIFAVMYESGIANGSNVWVVIAGRAEVYTWNSTSNGQIIRSAITGDATITAGQGMSVADLTTIAHLKAKVGVSIGGGSGAGLKTVKLSF